MDWDAARAHCKEKNWKWTLNLINKYQNKYGIEVVIIDYIGHIESDKLSYKLIVVNSVDI